MAIRAEEIGLSAATVDIDRDRRLVLRHQQGDGEAFDELYRRYHGRLVAYCQRRVGDRHVAEELAQEAFVRALRAMPGFAGERRFYPWMTVIARRLCIDHHRRSSRVEPAAQVDTGIVEPDHDAVFASVDRDHLNAALSRLAPRYREILELREERGWSYQQIASHLDVPMTTVEALLHRARKALRREFLAVAGDDRGGRFGLAVVGGAALAKVRAWLPAISPERWAPAVGTAAAGALAAGLVAGPLAPSGAPADVAPPTGPVVASYVTAATESDPPVDTAAGGGPVAVDVAPAPRPASAPAGPPPAVADLGIVAVYTGPEAVEWAEDANDQQPVHVPLGPVDIGANPLQLVGDVVDALTVVFGGTP